MRKLRLVALDEDGTHLVLRADGDDTTFALPIDERLHAALRGDRARLGQLEIQLESQLRPREIQARVRAGEPVESVAQAAGVPRDRVMRFAGPVLAEREHVAQRARRAALRRPGGEGPARVLDDAVTGWVAGQGGDVDAVEWNAWRRDDGRWMVSSAWRTGKGGQGHGTARFAFDPTGRSVVPDDEEARWVAGEPRPDPADPPAPTARPARSSRNGGPTRLSVVGGSVAGTTDAPPGDDDVTGSQEALGATARRGPGDGGPGDPVAAALAFGQEDPAPGHPVAGSEDDDDPTGPVILVPVEQAEEHRLRLSDIARHVEIDEDERADLDEEPRVPRAAGDSSTRGGSRGRRPSVPSWDEIMFGRRRKSD